MKRWMTVRLGLAMLGLFAVAGLLPSRALAEGATLFNWWAGKDSETGVAGFEYSPVAVPNEGNSESVHRSRQPVSAVVRRGDVA